MHACIRILNYDLVQLIRAYLHRKIEDIDSNDCHHSLLECDLQVTPAKIDKR